MSGLDAQWQRALVALLERSHLLTGDTIATALDEVLAPLRLRPELYLVDHEQLELRPLRPGAGSPDRVDSTVPGRAYQLGTVLEAHDADGHRVLWVPLVDGVERLGLLRVLLAPDAPEAGPRLRERVVVFSGTLAHVLASKLAQSDLLVTTRRRQPMSVAGELLWQLLPPLTVATDSLALAAVLEPAYDVSGDAFDYSVGATEAYFAIFDSSGHDLSAGLTTSVALAASRTARREHHDLAGMAERVDAALTEQFSDHRFVTGVLARLDVGTGRLRYLVAGHPAPVLVRAGRAVRTLEGARRMPLGRLASLAPQTAEPAEELLEPGDLVLLYSDGVEEARDADGEEFGTDRLIALAERAAADGLPAPETLRRLAHAVREHRGASLRDDATLVLVQWSGRAAERLLPRPAGEDVGEDVGEVGEDRPRPGAGPA
ncbi:PP2C family protein-serine/threonine phosphatase [Pseudonocardia kunmingensis]|uniref:Serine phosphatase RsbU (Regulator of sigma subunit) n=1 Tax=Pseudonocardia kunmingensis TaxID=630975 RepID=A0A543E1V3_9PSEU|nr:PP2C family protein-serine/threonine phosphatase [Pseudonocardia kunmingensis]TQM15571.1 serine phosphatase RsbU (regulator of sigma subunit) [Pseudonocardia kunmingensis]